METFPCRDCGNPVAWRTSKKGNRYLAQPKHWSGVETFAERCYWPRHDCVPNPEWKQQHAEAEARAIVEAITQGKIIKGVNVTVVKGRKVPKGTTGRVFWVAPTENEYGVLKAGIETQQGDKHFVPVEYLQVTA